MMMGLSRAAYEMQDYDKAIKSGNLAIKYTRQVPGVHKYLALTQKAKGDIDGAKKTISRIISGKIAAAAVRAWNPFD